MKKLLSILLITILTCMPCGEIFATSEKNIMTGNVMSVQTFKNCFGIAPEKRNSNIERSVNENKSSLFLSNIHINEEQISLTMDIINDSAKETLSVSGILRAGYRSIDGINSIILEVNDIVSGYEILFFEIFNDNKYNNLLVNKKLEGLKHIKVYLKDSNNQIHLYEAELPKEFENLNSNEFEYANKYKDALWAIPYVECVEKEIPTTERILSELNLEQNTTRAANTNYIWNNPTTYTSSFYVGNDYVTCVSLPYVEYRYTNVDGGDSTWTASFKVSEHMRIEDRVYYGTNVFDYRNLQLSFGCGNNTTFVRSFQEGHLHDYLGGAELKAGSEITLYLLKKIVEQAPAGSTITTVLSALNTMASSSSSVTLGNNNINLYSGKISAVGEKLKTRYTIEECTSHSGLIQNGHYFTYQAILTQCLGEGYNGETVGILLVKFDKYYSGDSSYTPVSKQINLYYQVSN